MPSSKAIQRRISSVDNTRQIVSAMEMLSATKLYRCRASLASSRYLHRESSRMIHSLRRSPEALSHPLITPRMPKRTLQLVISSDRGFCGSYNHKVATRVLTAIAAESYFEGHQDAVFALGRQGELLLRRAGVEIWQSVAGIEEAEMQNHAARTTKTILSLFNDGSFDRINLVFTRYEAQLAHQPHLQTLLPLAFGEPILTGYESMTYDPDLETFLQQIVPLHLTATLYAALVEAAVCEHTERMTSMHAATSSAEEIVEQLHRQAANLHKAQATQEINEISGAAKALQRTKETHMI